MYVTETKRCASIIQIHTPTQLRGSILPIRLLPLGANLYFFCRGGRKGKFSRNAGQGMLLSTLDSCSRYMLHSFPICHQEGDLVSWLWDARGRLGFEACYKHLRMSSLQQHARPGGGGGLWHQLWQEDRPKSSLIAKTMPCT